jgi:hypothetical protein
VEDYAKVSPNGLDERVRNGRANHSVDMGIDFFSGNMTVLVEKVASFRTDVIIEGFVVPSILLRIHIDFCFYSWLCHFWNFGQKKRGIVGTIDN